MGLPDRWLQYKPHGTVIPNTRFVAFKTPLKYNRVCGLNPHEQFTPAAIMRTFPNMKFVIDLTNSMNYYDSKEFTSNGINYVKINIPGKIVPPREAIERFQQMAEKFESMARRDELIGVHCTHGLNRTGFLICHYLIERLRMSPQAAIQVFERARGHNMERPEYVKTLKNKQSMSRPIMNNRLSFNNPNNPFNNPRRMNNPSPMIPRQVNGGMPPSVNRRPALLPTPPIPANLALLDFPIPPFSASKSFGPPPIPSPSFGRFNGNFHSGMSLNGSGPPFKNNRPNDLISNPSNLSVNLNLNLNSSKNNSLLGNPPLPMFLPSPPVSWRNNLNPAPTRNFNRPNRMDNANPGNSNGRKRKGNWVDNNRTKMRNVNGNGGKFNKFKNNQRFSI